MEVFEEVLTIFAGRPVKVLYDDELKEPLVDFASGVVELPSDYEGRSSSIDSIRSRFHTPLLSGILAHCAGYMRLKEPWWDSEGSALSGQVITYLGFIESIRADIAQSEARAVDTGFLAARIRASYPELDPALQQTLHALLPQSLKGELPEPPYSGWVEQALGAYESENFEALAETLEGKEIVRPHLYIQPEQWRRFASEGTPTPGGDGEVADESGDATPVQSPHNEEPTPDSEQEAGDSTDAGRPATTEVKNSGEEPNEYDSEDEDLLAEAEQQQDFKKVLSSQAEKTRVREKAKAEELSFLRAVTTAAKTVFSQKKRKRPHRAPTAFDHKLLKSVIKGFSQAKIRAPHTTTIKSSAPPGRLDTRAAVAGAAQESMGLPITAQPFRRTVRKKVEAPPPVMGLMCDVSGSMSDSIDPMSSVAWALAHATPKMGGKFAAVTFGRSVEPLLKVGEKPNSPPIFKARDSHEAGNEALLALTGHLNLLDSSKVRAVIISSDMMWGWEEKEKALKTMDRLRRSGVNIFVIPFTRTSRFLGIEYWWEGVATPITAETLEELPSEVAKTLATMIKNH